MPEEQIYFQGPLVAALQALNEHTAVAKESRDLHRDILEELRWQSRLLGLPQDQRSSGRAPAASSRDRDNRS
jgi:hypothetical protein